ncbi:MAG: cytochrome c oxidase subunit II [Gemmatimonadales bacterium]
MRVIDAMQGVLTSRGQPGGIEATLGRTFTIIMLLIVLLVTILLLAGVFRRRAPTDPAAITREGGGIAWILAGGVVMPIIGLGILFVLVLGALAGSARPDRTAVTTFAIVGHRWWWEIRQVDETGRTRFVTANELHVPVGRPVRLRLSSADVIHSFWVPQLAGKTDVIPGQTNDAWLQADHPGVYGAVCAEYCGMQHAHMALRVVAEDSASYEAWLAHEAAPASSPASAIAARGADLFVSGPCAACHEVRGTGASAVVGPDLTHVASRRTIGAGTLPNSTGNPDAWISNTQTIKPGNAMPAMALSGPDLQALIAFLEELR